MLLRFFFWVARYYDLETAGAKLETVERRSHIIPVDKNTSVEAAKIRIANKLALADSLILATARQEKATVVTDDPDLKGLEGIIHLS